MAVITDNCCCYSNSCYGDIYVVTRINIAMIVLLSNCCYGDICVVAIVNYVNYVNFCGYNWI